MPDVFDQLDTQDQSAPVDVFDAAAKPHDVFDQASVDVFDQADKGGFGDLHVAESKSKPAAPDSGFLASAGATIASDLGNTGAFLMTPHEESKQELTNTQTAKIQAQEQGLRNFDAMIQKRGYSTADDDRVRQSMVRDLDATRGDLSTKLATQHTPEMEAARVQREKSSEEGATKLRKWANETVWDLYGANPESTNAAAQIGRGVGGFAATVPSMALGELGLPAAIIQMGGSAYEHAKFKKALELKSQGVTDPFEIEQQSEDAGKSAFQSQLPALAMYMVGGKLAGSVAAKLAGPEASAMTKAMSSFAGATVANIGAGSVIRALEAPPGEGAKEAVPKIENLTADTLFAVFHGFGEYTKASLEAKDKAKQELVKRGFTDTELKAPATPPEETPAAEVKTASDNPEDAALLEEMNRQSAALKTAALERAAKTSEIAGLSTTADALRNKAATESVASEPAPAPAPVPPARPAVPPLTGPIAEIHRPEVDLIASLRKPYEPPSQVQSEQVQGAQTQGTLFPENQGTSAPAQTEIPAVAEQPTQTEVSGLGIQEVPISNLTLSRDVPQFKAGADEKGIVEPLAGKFDRTGVAPIQVWRRKNGQLEVISGRHRFDLAQRSGEATIPAQVHDEANGFDARAAARLDAELNIRDGQGSTADYANYFRNSELPEADATARGLLARAKGRAGFSIARNASEDVFALHQSSRLTDAQAESIANAAPGNDAAQRLGVRAMMGGAGVADAANAVRAAVASAGEAQATQGDFFSNTGLEEQWLAQGKIASQRQKGLREQIAAVQGAAKKPEVAKRLGVDVKDPSGVQKRIVDLKAELARWENWPSHPDLVAETRGTPPAAPKGDMFAGRSDDPFNLTAESPEDIAKREAVLKADEEAKAAADAAEAKRLQDEQQGNLFGSKTPATPENAFRSRLLDAAAKAKSQSEYDASGRQPGTIDFDRPDRPGTKVSILNTKEALTAASEKYRAVVDGSHTQRIAERVQEAKQNISGVRVRVLRNEGDLPADVRSRLDPRAVHEGVVDTDTGDVYIFSDNIASPERALEVFAHEVVGHYGVEKILAPDEWGKIADSIIQRNPDRLASIMRRYTRANDVSELTPQERDIVAREYIAELAEKPGQNPTVWNRVLQAVRNGLRALGIRRTWSEEDLRDLIRKAGKALSDDGSSRIVGGTRAAVRDLSQDVLANSPYASEVEKAFHEAVPSADVRTAVDEYVKAKLAGEEELPALSPEDEATAEKFVQYFQTKEDFADKNGVGEQVRAAYARQLAATPTLTLPERLAVFSSETNRAVAERTKTTEGDAGQQGSQAAPQTETRVPSQALEERTPGPTSIKNAVVDRERISRGLPPAIEPARRSFGRVWDEAMAMIDRDSTLPERLTAELEANPRAVEDWEDAILLHRQIELQNAHDQAAREFLNAREAGDGDAADAAQERANSISDKLLQVYNAGKSVGTATARGLNARKMMANENFTLAKMITDKRVANNGAPLTAEQHAQVVELHQRIADLEAKIAAHEAGKSEKESEQAATDAVKSMVDQTAKETPAASAKKSKVLAAISKKADEARARIRARRGTLNIGLNPAELLDYAIVGAEYFAKGAVSIGRFTAKIVAEFGDAVREHIPEIFARSKQLAAEANAERDLPAERAAIVEGMKERTSEGDTVADLAAYVRKLSLNLVRGGVTERDALIDTVHQHLQEIEPDITRRQTMDLISGYGDFKALDPEKAKVQLRDLKGQMQQIGKLEDMAAGKAPSKTGVQRREPSDEERRLIKEVNEAKKKGGFEVTDPATQLRSALGAKERAISNEIKAVAEEIATGERRKEPSLSPTNDRIEALKDLLGRLRETRDSIFSKPDLTDEQRLKLAIDAADRATAEYERQIREGDFAKKGKSADLASSPELEAAKARRDAARAERDEFRALDEAVRQQKEDARTKQLQDQIAEIDRRLREGDLDPQRPKAPELTPAQQDLVAERDAMLKLLNKLRRNPKSDEEKQIERLVKQVNEMDRRLREGDLATKKNSVTPLTPEAERLMSMRDAMSRALQDLRDAAKPKLSKEEIALKRWKSATANRIADLQEKTARGDFAKPPERKPMALDAEGQRLAFELDKAKTAFTRGQFEDMLRQRSTGKKILGAAGEVINTARAVMTAFDLSAVLRQGGFIALARPIRALRAFPAMFRAFGSEAGAHAVEHEIASRPNADLYRQAKLDLSKDGTKLSDMEEQYMSRWAKKIPLVAGSERAYRTFLNRLRADSFDAMASAFGRRGGATLAEAKAIANFINVATGRGQLGSKMATAAVGLNHVFFAPRLVLSRFQLLAGQPLWSGSMATRRAIAGEYARYLVGVGVVIALAKAAGSKDLETDPRSADFLKLRWGNTRLDPFSGLIQSTVVASRLLSGKTKNSSGQLVSLRTAPGEQRKFGQPDTTEVVGRFLRSKLSPVAGAALDVSSGRNLVGEPVTPGMAASRMFVPLTFGDVFTAMKERGMAGGAALSLLVILGAGLQDYDEKQKKH